MYCTESVSSKESHICDSCATQWGIRRERRRRRRKNGRRFEIKNNKKQQWTLECYIYIYIHAHKMTITHAHTDRERERERVCVGNIKCHDSDDSTSLTKLDPNIGVFYFGRVPGYQITILCATRPGAWLCGWCASSVLLCRVKEWNLMALHVGSNREISTNVVIFAVSSFMKLDK